MTAIDTVRSTSGTRPGHIVTKAVNAIVTWNDARVTRKALSQLTNRELDDIGLCRGDIEKIKR